MTLKEEDESMFALCLRLNIEANKAMQRRYLNLKGDKQAAEGDKR